MYTSNYKDAVDANSTSSVSDALDIRDASAVAFHIVDSSGAHDTHVFTLQYSLDDSNWNNSSTTLTGVGASQWTEIAAAFARVKCTTAQGATSVVNIIVQTK